MRYEENYLGHNAHYELEIQGAIESLNESVNEEIKKFDTLSSIKNVEFYIDEEETAIYVNVYFKSGDTINRDVIFFIDSSYISLTKEDIEGYFGEDKLTGVKKHLDDLEGVFNAEFLSSREPELYKQLSLKYLLDNCPNTLYGKEFTESDHDFFAALSREVS